MHASPGVPEEPPGPGELLGVLEEARRLLDEARARGSLRLGWVEARVYGNVWVVNGRSLEDSPLAVVGDIHGDARSLERVLELSEGSFRVFVGDYVDRGPPDGQVLAFYTVLRLLVDGAPVVPLRGNHEPPPGLEPTPHDYLLALRRVYGGEAARLYRASREVFDRLPHALIVEGAMLVVHGGPPVRPLPRLEEGSLGPVEYLGGGVYPPPLEVLEEVLWNDPNPRGDRDMPNFRRGAGFQWSESTTRRVLRLLGVELIVRGHESVGAGYKVDHGAVVTVFSQMGPPYWNEQAAIFYCDQPSPENLRTLRDEGRLEECIRVFKA